MDALILAGGENRRFMSQKALAEVHGRRIIETTAELLKKNFQRVWLSTNTPEIFFYLGLPMIGDILEQRGPMTGIYSGLSCTGTEALFVVACDMPFIQAGVVQLLLEHYKEQDAVLPVFNQKPQPMPGIYSGRTTEKMREHILADRMALWGFFQEVSAALISEDEVRAVDPDGRSFVNINTLEEYRNVVVHI